MKILFAASDCVPFIKTGGLADVVGALSPVLAQKGADVRVMVPLYASIPEKWTSQMKSECEFEVELGWRRQYCGVKSLEYQGVTFYFIDNHFYFGRSYIYGLGGESNFPEESNGIELRAECCWQRPGEDSVGFFALPAGYRFDNGTYCQFGKRARFWSKDEYGKSNAYRLSLTENSMDIEGVYRSDANSVRCVKNA